MADAGSRRRPADDRGGVPDALPPDSDLPRTPVHDSVPGRGAGMHDGLSVRRNHDGAGGGGAAV